MIKLKSWHIIERAIDEGVSCGYNRSIKHTETPSEEVIKAAMRMEVMTALCEVLDFKDME